MELTSSVALLIGVLGFAGGYFFCLFYHALPALRLAEQGRLGMRSLLAMCHRYRELLAD